MNLKKLLSLILALLALFSLHTSASAGKALTLKETMAQTEGMHAEGIRDWCTAQFASAEHADPAEIPYPDNRQEDGYLPEGEFVYEDAEKGL